MIHKWTEEVDPIQRAAKRALSKIGVIVSGYAISLCPVQTGRLRGSITYAMTSKQSAVRSPATAKDKIRKPSRYDELYLGTNVEYAQHIEYGTRHAGAQPFLRPAIDHNKRAIKEIFAKELKRAFGGK